MNKAIFISIPEPCHENWDQMTPNEQGRFCNACAKTVVDFSVMTDTQVLNYLIDKQHEKICGHVLPEQLDTPICDITAVNRKRKWYWNAATVFALLFTKSENTKAQKPPVKTEQAPLKGDTHIRVRGEVSWVNRPAEQDKFFIGKVLDSQGAPVPFASVIKKDGTWGVAADQNGAFIIEAAPGTVLRISATLYTPVEYVVTSRRKDSVILARVNEFQGYLGGLSIGYAVPRYKRKAVILIKDSETGKPVSNARMGITKNRAVNPYFVEVPSNGEYKLDDYYSGDTYQVNVGADGYQPNSFSISSGDAGRKLVQEVYLRKLPPVSEKSGNDVVVTENIKTGATENIPVIACTKDTTYLSKTEEPLKPGPVLVLAVNENNVTGQHAVSIYPNPVSRGNAMQIAWVVKQKGPHTILVNNSAGLLVWQKQETPLPGKFQTSILLDEKWSSGMYYLRILNPKGELVSENSFIVQ